MPNPSEQLKIVTFEPVYNCALTRQAGDLISREIFNDPVRHTPGLLQQVCGVLYGITAAQDERLLAVAGLYRARPSVELREIGYVAAVPDCRERGYATLLTHLLENIASIGGAEKVGVTPGSIPAKRFFKKRGYVLTPDPERELGSWFVKDLKAS